MAIKAQLLGINQVSNQSRDIIHSDVDNEIYFESSGNTDPYTNLVAGSRVIMYGRQNGDSQGQIIGYGVVTANGYVGAPLNKWVLTVRFAASDYGVVRADYPTGSQGVNFSYYEGIEIPDGETWTVQSIFAGSNDRLSVQAEVTYIVSGTDNRHFYTLLRSGEPSIGTSGDRTTAGSHITTLSRIDTGDEQDLLVIYDDGKA